MELRLTYHEDKELVEHPETVCTNYCKIIIINK